MAGTALSSPAVVSRAGGSPGVVPALPGRNETLDFIKGFLVVGMVVYHAINYFGYQFWDSLLYIKFVSGGFIFISGYIVTALYRIKWATAPRQVTFRLVSRGLKLVLLFTIINLAINIVGMRNFNSIQFGLGQFVANAPDIYIFGRGRIAAFEILLPIGYLLMVSPLLLWLARHRLVALVLLLGLSAVTLRLTWGLTNFTLLLIGGVGAIAGLLLSPDRLASARHLVWSSPALLACIVALPWLRGVLLGYIIYIMVVCKWVADFSQVVPPSSVLKKWVIHFGEYVLLAYIAHITLLQLIFRVIWPERQTHPMGIVLIICITCALLGVLVWTTAAARRRFALVDRAYRLVFA
jgi:hypothetical protein